MLASIIDAAASPWSTFAVALPAVAAALEKNGVRVLPVAGGAALHTAVADILRELPSGASVANLCGGRDVTGGVSALAAASLLEQCQVPYGGCSAALLARPLDVVLMMTWYAGLPLAPFSVVSTAAEVGTAAHVLNAAGPVRVCGVRPILALPAEELPVPTVECLEEAFRRHGKMVVWRDLTKGEEGCAYVLVSGGATRGALAVCAPHCVAGKAGAEAQLRRYAAAFSKDVLNDRGLAFLCFGRESNTDEWQLTDLVLNPDLSKLPSPLRVQVDGATLIADMEADAVAARPRPNFEVRLHSDHRRGYFLCATRNVTAGEIVFADECRSFAVVTRPFVEKNWDADLKKMFTEYAWPLDSEGHLYAIWEREPMQWRPINHSCDPNCVFAAPHSLNVIAARDIAAKEELSMDYATFCDRTMRPFTCLCGASCCRGLISPDEATLRKYGEHAWLRRAPPPVKPLL